MSDQPDLVSQILQSLYVDDLVSGASSEQEAYELFRRSTHYQFSAAAGGN